MGTAGLEGEARGPAGGGGGAADGAAAGARGAGCSGGGGDDGWRHLLRWEPPPVPGEAAGPRLVWEGETPWEALLSLCAAGRSGGGVPLPACRLREAPGGRFFGECFLSHMGVLVAPHCAFGSEEEALQNTALLGLSTSGGRCPSARAPPRRSARALGSPSWGPRAPGGENAR